MVRVKMADSDHPRAKKAKRSTTVCQVSAEEHAKQFNVDSGMCSADLVSTT